MPTAKPADPDQIAAYDAMRARCPVAHSDRLHWSIFRHEDVSRVLDDPATFTNTVSAHVAVPNGMDGAEHTEFRRIIDPYFDPQKMAAFEPVCRALAAGLVRGLPGGRDVDVMAQFAPDFTLRALSAFLDWPEELQAALREWSGRNHDATRSGDPGATAAVAAEFDAFIKALLDLRRRQGCDGSDAVSRLLAERVHGRAITDDELVSLLRNWTVGELATVAASVGIVIAYLAGHPELQQHLLENHARLSPAIDEILRIHPPLIASRRKTRRAVEIGGQLIPAGERLTLMWASANRDERVFGDPNELRLDRDPMDNLLYGAGIHACPGAPLARLTLRVLVEELLRHWRIEYSGTIAATFAVYPAAGFKTLGVRFIHRDRG